MPLISPHGADELRVLLLSGEAQAAELQRAEGLAARLVMTTRETGDLIMMGIGGFTPLTGFMGREDWRAVCGEMRLPSQGGLFWPVPVTLSHAEEIPTGTDVCLVSGETGEIMGTLHVAECYRLSAEDRAFECKSVFGTADPEHPGVKKVLEQKEWNVAGPVKVLSESYFPRDFADVYMRPAESRRVFEERGWTTIAALQLRNPMHRSHEYLAKIAIEVSDGVFIHQLVGKLKPGDIPADVRVRCIDALVEGYFVRDRVVTGGYPLDMRYAGPREGLLHAVFRQNYGCTHMIIGRDHAGVGDYYGPFDAQFAFNKLWPGALKCKMLPIDWTFWCCRCFGMCSLKTCPHKKEDRIILSGTALRKLLSEGGEVPPEFSRPEVLVILREYYDSLTEKVEITLHGHATGESGSAAGAKSEVGK